MIFEYFETGPLLVNCYIIGDEETREAAVVDPGGNVDEILTTLARHNLTLTKIIMTHCHFDHVGGIARLARVTDAPIYIHKAEKFLYDKAAITAKAFGMSIDQPPEITGFIEEGKDIKVGKLSISPYHCPGHSPGSVCLVINGQEKVITGDVLFQMSIGRTDMPGGSMHTLIDSIRSKLLPLADETTVHPGHGPTTTIGYERNFNPFLEMVANSH